MTSEFTIAVHSLVYLNHKASTVKSNEIADNVCTNPARIRKILAKLTKAGLIETKEGKNGGYYFSKKAKDVTLDKVLTAINENTVDALWKSGDINKECLISSGMSKVIDEIYFEINNISIKFLKEISIDDINNKIFNQI